MIVDGSLGTRLKRLRSARRRSLSELSLCSGIGKGTISELENDRRGARLDTLFALTTALDVPLGALLPDEHLPTRSVVQGEPRRSQSFDGPAQVVLLMHYPRQQGQERPVQDG